MITPLPDATPERARMDGRVAGELAHIEDRGSRIEETAAAAVMAVTSVMSDLSEVVLVSNLTGKVNSHLSEKVNSHSGAEIIDFVALSQKVNSHFSGRRWKQSRVKPGWLIARLKGYDIVESEYGINYLFVVARQPRKFTSADFSLYEHAGFFTWQAMEAAGRLIKEKQDESKRIPGNRTRAS